MAALDHRGQKPTRQRREGQHVQLQEPLVAFDLDVGEAAHVHQPRVVHEDVDAQAPLAQGLDQGGGGLRREQVGGQHRRAHVVFLPDLLGQRLELGFAACHEDQVVPLARKAPRQLQADSGGGTGDEDGLGGLGHGFAPAGPDHPTMAGDASVRVRGRGTLTGSPALERSAPCPTRP